MKNIFKLNESEKNRIRGLHGMQLITEEINAECSELFAKLGREILSSRNNEIDTSSDAGKGNRIKKGFSGQEENNQAYALLSKQIKEQKIECKK